MTTITAEHDVKCRREEEKRELEAIRGCARLASFRDSQQRFDELDLLCATALKALEDAYLNYNDDELDVERAIDNARHLESMERDYDRLMKKWDNQRQRIEWERKNSQ
jgi:hypothetical protein